MRVLQLIHQKQLRGAEVFASQLSNDLSARGHEVKLAAIYGGNIQGELFYPVFSLEAGKRRKWLDYSGWKKVAQLCEDFQPDIVQANAGDTLVYAAVSKMIFKWKAPVVYRNASMMTSYLKSGVSKRIYAWLLKGMNAIASVASDTSNDLLALCPELKSKMVIIPVGVIVDNYLMEQKKTSGGDVHLIHVGGFTFEKNHIGLLRIFKELLRTHPSSVLHLVGDGPLRKNIEELATAYGIECSVVFHGAIRDPLKSFGHADALLLPSLIEGAPAIILEGFAAGIPVIAYNVGGIRHLVQNNITGYLVEKNDEGSFVQAVVAALSERNTGLVQNARQQVVEHYNNEKICTEFEDLYKQLVV